MDTIHHDVLSRALQWVNDQLEDRQPDLSTVTSFFNALISFREETTVQLDQVLQFTDPYDTTTAPPELYGFADELNGDSLVDSSGTLAPYGLLMILLGPCATDDERDRNSDFRRQLHCAHAPCELSQ